MLNRIVIMGRLTRDPEMKKTASGISVANFSIACDRDFFGKDEEKQTDFIDCTAWRSTADFIGKYFTKGRMIVVYGRLQVRKWQNKDGENRYSTEVVAENVYFGDSKKESSGNSYSSTEPLAPPASDFIMLEDDDAQLPF